MANRYFVSVAPPEAFQKVAKPATGGDPSQMIELTLWECEAIAAYARTYAGTDQDLSPETYQALDMGNDWLDVAVKAAPMT